MNIVKVNEEIFREYDIRGVYGIDIDEDVSYTIGRSFGSYIKNKVVIIGHDNRASSPVISSALISGLLESGCEVIDLGLVTTPMYYFAKKKNKIESGIMVTASHNPKEYNGFKISFDIIGNACGEMIYSFRDYTNKGVFASANGGKVTLLDIREDYLDLLKKSISLGDKRVKVVVDCGNGTGSVIIKEVMNLFNVECQYLYCDSNPDFPNHQPDPAVKHNQMDISNKVRELDYDYGFSVDGDADRVGVVDELGNIIPSDLYLDIIYRDLQDKASPKKAIYDVKCSKSLIDDLESMGYEQTMYRTGNSYMNMKINGDDYMFGGEFSGHVWFRDRFPGFDDGIYAGLRVLEILSRSDKKLSELLLGLNKYYSTEENKLKVTEENKFKIVDSVKKYCDEKGYKYNSIDGVRVMFDDSWALVRASNTGPNIITRFESKSEERLKMLENEFTSILKSFSN
ncbi:MAG: phosphomannomutase/phosphoglucomutase [Bacilli bacterium]|nr:phosphomannomutase/phosphoglucomutase [Bacilli bacterium]